MWFQDDFYTEAVREVLYHKGQMMTWVAYFLIISSLETSAKMLCIINAFSKIVG